MIHGNEILAKIEARQLWSNFHKDFLLEVRGFLRQQLPREYRVFVESQAVVISPPLGEHVASVEMSASLEVEENCETFTTYSLVIRRAPENRLVAACEMLSPTNKGLAGKLEEDKYLRKRDLYIESGVNLLEIDALLEGDRLLPASVSGLSRYARNAWTLLHTKAKPLARVGMGSARSSANGRVESRGGRHDDAEPGSGPRSSR